MVNMICFNQPISAKYLTFPRKIKEYPDHLETRKIYLIENCISFRPDLPQLGEAKTWHGHLDNQNKTIFMLHTL